MSPSPFGALAVQGLRVGDADLSVAVAADGTVADATTGAPVALDLT
ncbi:MAG: hypothetical protein H5T83_09530 [Actinotalea sp.]|nr:hypothetical protein [Actinotalea sp.]